MRHRTCRHAWPAAATRHATPEAQDKTGKNAAENRDNPGRSPAPQDSLSAVHHRLHGDPGIAPPCTSLRMPSSTLSFGGVFSHPISWAPERSFRNTGEPPRPYVAQRFHGVPRQARRFSVGCAASLHPGKFPIVEARVAFAFRCGALSQFSRLCQNVGGRISGLGTPLPNEGRLSGRIP